MLPSPGSIEWADDSDSEASPENSAAAAESVAVPQRDCLSLRQEQAEMSETEAGAGEEPEQWCPSESRPTLCKSKNSMEPRVTSDLEVLEALDIEDSWMCSTSRGSVWAGRAGARDSVHGGTIAGARDCEKEKFVEAEESLATLVEMERVEAFVEGGVRLTAEKWADPNIVLPSRLILNGGISGGSDLAFELR